MADPVRVDDSVKLSGSTPDRLQVLMVDSMVGNDYAFCLSDSLAQAGADVNLVTTKDRDSDADDAAQIKIMRWSPVKAQAGKFGKALEYASYLFRLLRFALTHRQSVVHFQFFRRPRAESVFFVLLRLLGVNLVYTAHNAVPHENNRLDSLLTAAVYQAARLIIVHSEFMRKLLVKKFGLSPGKIQVIPHGDFDIYLQDSPLPPAGAREKLGLHADDHVLLFFGFIREYKGLDLLLDAFEQAAVNDPRLKLVIAGAVQSGGLDRRYRSRIQSIRDHDRILYHNNFVPSDQVSDYFSAADLVVLPYRHIYHSGVVHVAYSFGKPIIATQVGDFPETIEDGASGYIVPKNDPEKLAAAIGRAFKDQGQLASLGRHAKHLSQTKYAWRSIGKKTVQAYDIVLN